MFRSVGSHDVIRAFGGHLAQLLRCPHERRNGISVGGGIAFVGSWLVKRYLKSTYKKWSKIENQHGVTGAQTAAAILEDHGVSGGKLEEAISLQPEAAKIRRSLAA